MTVLVQIVSMSFIMTANLQTAREEKLSFTFKKANEIGSEKDTSPLRSFSPKSMIPG